MRRGARAISQQSVVRVVSIGITLLVTSGLIIVFGRQLPMLLALLGVVLFGVLSYVWPLPMLVLEMVASTSVLKFIGVKQWPHYIPGAPLDPPDLLVIAFFAIGVIKLIQRRERPVMMWPLAVFGVMAFLSTILGPVTGTQTFYESLNGLRQLSGYLFCIGVIGIIDSPRRLHGVLGIVFVFVLVTVGIQLVEAARGQQFTTALRPFNEYYGGEMTVSVGKAEVPYLWNRAGGYLLVGLFLALSQGLWRASLRHYLIALLALLAYVAQLIRQWYAYIAIGTVVSIALLRRERLKATCQLVALLGLVALSVAILTWVGQPALPIGKLWIARIGTFAHAEEEPNVIFRVQTWHEQLRLFRQEPLFGYGPGSSNRLGVSGGAFRFFDLDTGMSNSLLQYGIFGTASIWLLIVAFFRQALRLYRRLPDSPERGYVAGLIAVWVVMVAGYLTFQDFFTAVELAFAAGLAVALLDRFSAFADQPTDGKVESRDEPG